VNVKHHKKSLTRNRLFSLAKVYHTPSQTAPTPLLHTWEKKLNSIPAVLYKFQELPFV